MRLYEILVPALAVGAVAATFGPYEEGGWLRRWLTYSLCWVIITLLWWKATFVFAYFLKNLLH